MIRLERRHKRQSCMPSLADLIRRESAGTGLVLIRVFLSCLLVLTIVTYFSAIDGPFQYDDHHSIVDNPHIRSLQGAVSFLWSPQSFSEDPRSAMYRPLVLISYAVNYALHGYETSGYHLLNIRFICSIAASCICSCAGSMVAWWARPRHQHCLPFIR